MLAFSIDYYGIFFGATQSVELFCTYDGQQWFKQLQTYLRTVNKSKVSVTNVSMGGNASYAGYVRTMALNDDVNYDLAIICYGQNDSTDGFSTNYESIIRAIRSKYPDCSIISILESSQREYTEKMTTIQSICEHYGIPIANTIDAFNNSEKAYAASTGKMADVDVINADVHKFDNFVWYDASSDLSVWMILPLPSAQVHLAYWGSTIPLSQVTTRRTSMWMVNCLNPQP